MADGSPRASGCDGVPVTIRMRLGDRGRILIVAGLLHLAARASAPTGETVRLTILHTNDVHGRLLPFAYAEQGRGGALREDVGGAARRATLIRRLRAEIPGDELLLDAGDVFTRGALTNAYEGQADIAAMNVAGYDAGAIGNNEFKARDAVDAGDARGSQAALLRFVRASRFPWLCANLADGTGKPLPGIRPYVIKRINGLRVGIVSVTAPRSAGYPQTRGWRITDPFAAMKSVVPEVRKRCDIVIALTHIGMPMDLLLAGSVDGIDAIVGGDSHTFLYEPLWVTGPSGRRVPIVQDGEYGVNVGRLDLNFGRVDGDYRLVSAEGRLTPVDGSLPADPKVQRVLAPFLRPFEKVIGGIPDPGATRESRSRATTQLTVDAMRRAAGTDLALNPLGAGLIDVLTRSRVRRYDLYAAMPFRNIVITVLLRGAEVRELVRKYPSTCWSGDLDSVQPDRIYRVAMVDYVADTEYRIPSVRIIDRGVDIRVAVERYLASSFRSSATTPTPGARSTASRSPSPFLRAHKLPRDPGIAAGGVG